MDIETLVCDMFSYNLSRKKSTTVNNDTQKFLALQLKAIMTRCILH